MDELTGLAEVARLEFRFFVNGQIAINAPKDITYSLGLIELAKAALLASRMGGEAPRVELPPPGTRLLS